VPSFPIQVGSTGDDVRRVQRAIVRWRAYYGLTGHPPMTLPAVDGVFGAVTDAAVRVFQTFMKDEGGVPMPSDGIVGPLTWGALGPYKEATSTVRVRSTGPVVLALQKVLQSGPVDDGPFYAAALDGRFGPITEASVRAYQTVRGITVDGIAGEQTWLAPASAPGPTLDTAAGLT
jgi:peptidoglycan hydrolase-like protein with peptidoglycan-binding domain